MSEARGRPTEARPAPRAAPVNAHLLSAHRTSQPGFTKRSAGDTASRPSPGTETLEQVCGSGFTGAEREGGSQRRAGFEGWLEIFVGGNKGVGCPQAPQVSVLLKGSAHEIEPLNDICFRVKQQARLKPYNVGLIPRASVQAPCQSSSTSVTLAEKETKFPLQN